MAEAIVGLRLRHPHWTEDVAREVAERASGGVWCADFKGWFRTADGQRCDPLTISDGHSPFLLDCRITAPTGDGGRRRRPVALAVHWVKLGIRLEHIEPGQPQQNGRHRTLKPETWRPPAATPSEQQARFDAFRQHYNHERPRSAKRRRPSTTSRRPGAIDKPQVSARCAGKYRLRVWRRHKQQKCMIETAPEGQPRLRYSCYRYLERLVICR